MDLMTYIAERIRCLRTTYGGDGISQEHIAKELGVAANTVSRWETGAYRPSVQDLDKLARFFNISILEFFPQEEKPANPEVAALLRAVNNLKEEDVRELTRYAEFRRAQSLYREGARRKPGRPRRTEP